MILYVVLTAASADLSCISWGVSDAAQAIACIAGTCKEFWWVGAPCRGKSVHAQADLPWCRHVAYQIGFPALRASMQVCPPCQPENGIEDALDRVTAQPQALKVAQLKQVCRALSLNVSGATHKA